MQVGSEFGIPLNSSGVPKKLSQERVGMHNRAVSVSGVISSSQGSPLKDGYCPSTRLRSIKSSAW